MLRPALLALSILCFAASADAKGGPKNRTFGLGLQFGAPTGITGKVFFGEIPALAFGFGVGWPFAGIGGWVDLDLHFLRIKTKRSDVLTLRLYAGPGLQLGFAGPYYYYTYAGCCGGPAPYRVYYPYYEGRYYGGYAFQGYGAGAFSIAVRGPVGLTIHWTKVAFDTYAELGPSLHFVLEPIPRVFLGFLFAVGARYYF